MKTLEFPVPRPALAPVHSIPVRFEPGRAERVFLLAEASEDHAFFTERAFSAAGITDPLQVVTDGEAAMNYLRGTGRFNRLEHPLPDVVLLDRGLPGKSCFEVLKWLRAQPDLRALLVIVLTTSNRKADADRAFELGANYYLTKPTSFDALVRLTRCLHGWLHCHHFQVPPVAPEQALLCAVPSPGLSCTSIARRSQSPPGKAAEAVSSRAVCGHTVRRRTRGQHSRAGLPPAAAGRA